MVLKADSGPVTVGSALRDAAAELSAAGSETPRLDAEVLLGHVLGFERATLLVNPDLALPPAQAGTFETLLARRATGEPVSYIRGFKEFYGLAINVDGRALIPRPETELIVDLALDMIKRRLSESARPADAAPYLVWDVGTGSGAIVVALAVEARRRRYDSDVRFRATDASPDALALAVENAVGHGVADLIKFEKADLAASGTVGGPRRRQPALRALCRYPDAPRRSQLRACVRTGRRLRWARRDPPPGGTATHGAHPRRRSAAGDRCRPGRCAAGLCHGAAPRLVD